MERKDLIVPVEKLRHVCDPADLKFGNTSELEPLTDFIGQESAIEALKFGLEIETPGYNIFAAGPNGTGRTSVIKEHIKKSIREKKVSPKKTLRDFCYVGNFENPDKPQVLVFKKGEGKEFKDFVEEVILERLKVEIPAVLQGQECIEAKKELIRKCQDTINELSLAFANKVKESGFVLLTLPMRPGTPQIAQLSPLSLRVSDDGKLLSMSKEEFAGLTEEARTEIKKREQELADFEDETNLKIEELQEKLGQDIKALEDGLVEKRVVSIFKTQKYQNNPKAREYLCGLKKFTLKNIGLFRPQANNQAIPMLMLGGEVIGQPKNGNGQFLPFKVNLFIDNGRTEEIPVIVENNPTFANLFGKVDKGVTFGTYVTDHTRIRPGSLCLADGGYIILNVLDIFSKGGEVWQALEKTLKSGFLKIGDPLGSFGFSPVSLDPEEIPLNVKVIIVGEPEHYEILQERDEDFASNFKVKVEFDDEMKLNQQNLEGYARFISRCCQKEKLLPFDRTGVGKIVEFGSRLADHQQKLSARMGLIKNLVVEAEHWAKKAQSQVATGEHVRRAIEERRQRTNLLERKVQKTIDEGIRLIETQGQKVGEINGLVVYQLGDLSFGRPSRITVKTFKGKDGVISVDREVGMSGPNFNKAVGIIKGYFGEKYGQKRTLEFSASICFEQSYGGIEGDSASVAEISTLLSSLAKLPINQALAVTGSINQNGEVQPIGGVNEKIEGFFEVCRERGFTGKQGVIIPHQNVQDLMLREDVVEAVSQKQFTIYQIKTVDEGMELLMSKPAQIIHKLVADSLHGKSGWLRKRV